MVSHGANEIRKNVNVSPSPPIMASSQETVANQKEAQAYPANRMINSRGILDKKVEFTSLLTPPISLRTGGNTAPGRGRIPSRLAEDHRTDV